jgi:hypothetical protein
MKPIPAVCRESRRRPVTGDLVKLATARSQAEPDILHDLMLDEGVRAYRPSHRPLDGRCGVGTGAATRGSSRSRRVGQRG